MTTVSLGLLRRTRAWFGDPASGNPYKTRRTFFDYVIEGVSLQTESCSVAEIIDIECGNDSTAEAGFGAATLAMLGVPGGIAYAGWWVVARWIGEQGEAIVAEATGLVKNTNTLTGSPEFRTSGISSRTESLKSRMSQPSV
jgi:hypothetical protein